MTPNGERLTSIWYLIKKISICLHLYLTQSFLTLKDKTSVKCKKFKYCFTILVYSLMG